MQDFGLSFVSYGLSRIPIRVTVRFSTTQLCNKAKTAITATNAHYNNIASYSYVLLLQQRSPPPLIRRLLQLQLQLQLLLLLLLLLLQLRPRPRLRCLLILILLLMLL